MNTTYETFKKDNRLKLFGHEDAGKEDDSRLTSYYYKTLQYEDVMSDIKLQIITGEKGTGKSALLKMAYIETSNTDIVPIWIRLDDLSELYSDILDSNNLYQLKTLWKRSISKLVIMNLVLYLFPYITDMAHNNIIIAIIWFFPNPIIYLLFTKYYSGILSQQQ